MGYWLLKSEPKMYSIDDLKQERVGRWDGVRNYQARNLMRDEIKKGDIVLFYHSNIEPVGIVGIAKVVQSAYPDPTQFDKDSKGYDPRATEKRPRWIAVDIRFIEKFAEVLTLKEMKGDPLFNDMLVIKRGMRLSVQPVSKKHFDRICILRSKRKHKQ